ncbi:hypothetical protein PFISCL1PPCAC_3469, partial [Pristionchus fissidentatus]
MTTLDTYPDIMIQDIAKRLDYNEIRAMKLVHTRFHSALSDPLIWIQLCERDNRILPSYAFRKSLAEQIQKDENRSAQLFERIWAKDPFRSQLRFGDPYSCNINDKMYREIFSIHKLLINQSAELAWKARRLNASLTLKSPSAIQQGAFLVPENIRLLIWSKRAYPSGFWITCDLESSCESSSREMM